jgi:four helix bundle protein
MELETHLIVAQELGYLARERLILFQEQIESIGQMLNGLVRALRARQMAHEPRIPNPGPR